MSNRHLIRQQYLHVEMQSTEADGLSLQRRLSIWCHEALMPAMGRALDRCAPSEERLCLERLEVDAGSLMLDRVEEELADIVTKALVETLRAHLSTEPSSGASSGDRIRRKTEQDSTHEAFFHFLRTGTLPWWFRLPHGASLEEVMLDVWRKAVASPRAVNSDDTILQVLASATARKRLIQQFSPVFLKTLLTRLSPAATAAIDEVLSVLQGQAMPPVAVKDGERALWEAAFANAASDHVVTPDHLACELWRALPARVLERSDLARLWTLDWPGAAERTPAARGPRSDTPISQQLPFDHDPLDMGHPDAREGIFIENAGLVILHPFLPQLFSTLGLAAEEILTQPERALCLLHFLATGQIVAPEYELVLPKILCHVPLGTPVESHVELTIDEQSEAEALLEAVIHHWEVLRNTSPDGLRGIFLLRPGKISLRDDGEWLLQVESNSYDILLDQLPWGISMIKLSWMDAMLRVEWR